MTASQVAAFDEGEWLDLVNERGRRGRRPPGWSGSTRRRASWTSTSAAPIRPSEGIVRPRPQTKILAQKRAILGQLESPTGDLPLRPSWWPRRPR